MLKALIFDFDGLILDTETPQFDAWQQIYQTHGAELSLQDWAGIVGGQHSHQFDPAMHLSSIHKNISAELLNRQAEEMYMKEILLAPILPGVQALIKQARQQGLLLAVASSSQHDWIDNHLKRLGLFDHFNTVVCREDVQRAKPAPDLFQKALTLLKVNAAEAIVFEDSPNGAKAACQAEIFCVVVPNPLTKQLYFEDGDLLLNNMQHFSLDLFVAKE